MVEEEEGSLEACVRISGGVLDRQLNVSVMLQSESAEGKWVTGTVSDKW